MKPKIILTKISDDKFNGEHPNGIYEGRKFIGQEVCELKVGTSYIIENLRTSTVTEILDGGIFKTRNSTYKREVIE